MHHAVAVDVIQRIAYAQRDSHRAFGRQLALFVHQLAQQPSLHPLHHHVAFAALFVIAQDLHHPGMIQFSADLLFALEALEKHRVAFHLNVRNLDGDRAPGARVPAAEDRSHTAARGHVLKVIVVELPARLELSHCLPRRHRGPRYARLHT